MLRPHNNVLLSILSTLAYFDIFDFPLEKSEVYKFLHTSHSVSQEEVEKILVKVPHKTINNRIFYFLTNRESLVAERIEQEKISERKLKSSILFIRLLSIIPTIVFIGISGSLAMKNGDEDSDIDLFIITLPNTLWVTRFLVWIMLLFTLKQRKRNSQGKDSICVNMLLDRSHMYFPKERQDLYTAHEIAQLVPIVDRYNTHELFLEKNQWALGHLGNSFGIKQDKNGIPRWARLFGFLNLPIEKAAMRFQLLYMKRHKTIEQTTDKIIAFHPYDYRDTITKEYKKRLEIYGI